MTMPRLQAITDPLVHTVPVNWFWQTYRISLCLIAAIVLVYAIRQFGNRNPWSLTNMASTSLLVALEEFRLFDTSPDVLVWKQILFTLICVSCIVVMRRGSIQTSRQVRERQDERQDERRRR